MSACIGGTKCSPLRTRMDLVLSYLERWLKIFRTVQKHAALLRKSIVQWCNATQNDSNPWKQWSLPQASTLKLLLHKGKSQLSGKDAGRWDPDQFFSRAVPLWWCCPRHNPAPHCWSFACCTHTTPSPCRSSVCSPVGMCLHAIYGQCLRTGQGRGQFEHLYPTVT